MNTRARWLIGLLVVTWALALVGAMLVPEWLNPATAGDGRVRQTIRLALLSWFLAAFLMTGLDGTGWRACGTGRLVRWIWTLGWITYVVHVGVAFHYSFGWSQTAALAHTQARSGFGEGLFVSYGFTLLWALDVAWWWLAPSWYGTRYPWWGRLLHGFLVFVIFNGTVVYEAGAIRWISAAAFAVLGARFAICIRRRSPERRQALAEHTIRPWTGPRA